MFAYEKNFIKRMEALEQCIKNKNSKESEEEVASTVKTYEKDIRRLIAVAQKLRELGVCCWDYMKFSTEKKLAFVANYNTQRIDHLGYSSDENHDNLVLFDGLTGTLVRGGFTKEDAEDFEEELDYFKEDFYQFVDEILGLDLYRHKDD